jgi:hypothetical protein
MRILTDCDGVLLNWEYSFNVWMERHGYKAEPGNLEYDIGLRYGLSPDEKKKLVKHFNESSAIGFLPPLRDAIHYVDKLHRKHGVVFHVITSLSLEPTAQMLRTKNLKKLFGDTVFEKFIYLDTGADKDEILAEYAGSGDIWIEDKYENAIAGLNVGLEPVLIEHGHNMDVKGIPLMKNWKEVYDYVAG